MNKHCGTCDAFAANQRLSGELRAVKQELKDARAEATDWKRRYTELEDTIGSISVEPTGEPRQS